MVSVFDEIPEEDEEVSSDKTRHEDDSEVSPAQWKVKHTAQWNEVKHTTPQSWKHTAPHQWSAVNSIHEWIDIDPSQKAASPYVGYTGPRKEVLMQAGYKVRSFDLNFKNYLNVFEISVLIVSFLTDKFFKFCKIFFSSTIVIVSHKK